MLSQDSDRPIWKRSVEVLEHKQRAYKNTNHTTPNTISELKMGFISG